MYIKSTFATVTWVSHTSTALHTHTPSTFTLASHCPLSRLIPTVKGAYDNDNGDDNDDGDVDDDDGDGDGDGDGEGDNDEDDDDDGGDDDADERR